MCITLTVIPKKDIKAVIGGKVFITVAKMVFAELAGSLAETLHHHAHRRIELAETHGGTWEADLGETGPETMLTGQEGRPAGRATLFAIVVQKPDAFICDSINVRGRVAHQTIAVGTDVGNPDVITEDDKNVGLVCCGISGTDSHQDAQGHCN